ncbi:MAG: hypothetical protein Q4C14_00630 [Bacillota bacterium]|nr:hypothetical protein [Bacillota bacterium]
MMNKILVFLNETPEIKIAATVLIIVAVALIIGLLLRSTRLWYWKTDKIIDAVNEIGGRIDDVEEEMGSVKISTERLLEEIRLTNEAMFALREQISALPQGVEALPEPKQEQTDEAVKDDDSEASSAETAPGENLLSGDPVREQVEDLDKILRGLKKQKEQLEAEINSRIRD